MASVYYSADGVAWRSLAAGVTTSSITVPRDQLAGSGAGTLRVVVSDGLNSALAEVDGLVVADNAPTLTVVSPAVSSVFAGRQTIRLEATGFDREDGPVTEVTWVSDIDGVLGVGRVVTLPADGLSEGQHTITASVVDAAGTVVRRQVSVAAFSTPVVADRRSARERIEAVVAALDATDDRAAARAAAALRPALAEELWVEAGTLADGGEAVFRALRAAARIAADSSTTAADGASHELVAVARIPALRAVDSVDPTVEQAAKVFREQVAAEIAVADGNADTAIDQWRKVWKTVS